MHTRSPMHTRTYMSHQTPDDDGLSTGLPFVEGDANSTLNTSGFDPMTSSLTSDRFQHRDQRLVRVEVTVQAVILVATVVGNVLVLLALARRAIVQRQRCKYHRQAAALDVGAAAPRQVVTGCRLSRMDFMIFHLAVADLSAGFFNVLPQLIWDATGHFQGNDLLCRLVAYLQVVAMYGSSYVLTATAIDRYLSICHPLRSFTWSRHRMVRVLIGVAWTASGLLAAPQLVIWGYREVDASSGVYECWAVFEPQWTLTAYMTWSTLAIYVIPLVGLTVAYGRICVAVWHSSRAPSSSNEATAAAAFSTNGEAGQSKDDAEMTLLRATSSANCTSCDDSTDATRSSRSCSTPAAAANSDRLTHGAIERRPAVSRAKVKTVKLTVAVVLSYLICWCPYFVSQMWAVWDDQAPFEGAVMTITALLASLNSCMNPLIYFAFVGTGFRVCRRRSALKAKCRRRRKPREVNQHHLVVCLCELNESDNGCSDVIEPKTL